MTMTASPSRCVRAAAIRSARALVAALLLAATCAAAHQDHVLRRAADGALDGLPPTHAPGRLALAFARVDGAARLASLALELHGARVVLPACVLGYVHTERAADVQVRASWEHDESVVPHYLQVVLNDSVDDASGDTADAATGGRAGPAAASDDAARPGFSLLFDLRSARLIEMSVQIVTGRDGRVQNIPVDLHARCAADELDGVLLAPPRERP